MKLTNRVSAFFLISALSLYVLTIGHAQSKTDALTWIASHKNASSQEIDAFVTKELLKIKDLKEAYTILNAIMHTYRTSIIPLSVYTTYAHLAQLSFDFTKALNMYLRAYNNTKEEHYLIRASIHALEAGDTKTAFVYLSQAENMTLSDAQRVFLNITQAKVLIQDGQPDMALASLQTLPFLVGQEKLTSNFYYALYHVARRNGKTVEANLAHQILTKQFPYSIEVYMLNSLRIQPLPLPSQLFTLHSNSEIFTDTKSSAADFTSQDAQKDTSAISSQVPQQKRKIQKQPKAGYQVAAFTDLANAQTAFEYYYNLWRSRDIDAINSPVLTQKDVSGLRFYQIIFPFDDAIIHDSDEQHKILKQLREHNIEGGFIITQ